MIFVDNIVIIVLPIWQVFKKNFFGEMLFFGPHSVRKVENLQKKNGRDISVFYNFLLPLKKNTR